MNSLKFVQVTPTARALIFPILLSSATLWSNPGAAEGALAIGLPAHVEKDGFAYAYHIGKEPADDARRAALESCREPAQNKAAAARKLCKVIASFHDQCVAVAEDPQAGTPGVGWAITDTLRDAEASALEKCEATAGAGRRAACRVDHSQCDGTAK